MEGGITDKIRSVLYPIKNRLFPGSREYWEERYRQGGDSGVGSYGKIAEFKAEVINEFVMKNGIDTITEFGCGDGNQLSLFDVPDYVGLDVSERAVESCKERFKHDDGKRFFLYEPENFDVVARRLKADLTLSLDVIFHIIEDDTYELYMEHLFDSANKFVIIYSDNVDTKQRYHVKRRRFTEWVDTKARGWGLTRRIKNRYPEISESDFYVYRKAP